MDFRFDKQGFDKVIEQALNAKRAETQALFDRMLHGYAGRPVLEVRAALVQEWRRSGGTIDGSEATDWATKISQGIRIVVR